MCMACMVALLMIYHLDNAPFPKPRRVLGRWLGVAHRVGQALCYWVLTNTGKVITHTTIQKLTSDELHDPLIANDIESFDKNIEVILKQDHDKPLDDIGNIYLQDVDIKSLQDVDEDTVIPLDNDAVMPEADVTPDVDSYNKYLAARVILPRGDVLERETITPGRGTMREPWSVKHTFLDGHVGEYSTNIIAENIYATVDNDGYETKNFKDIVDHRSDPSIAPNDEQSWIIGHNGNRSQKRTTIERDLCGFAHRMARW